MLSREEALAKREPGLDLVEISPNANPPVARLINFDKFRYQQEKAEKKERQLQKSSGMKQVQISARAAHNDLLIKAQQADKFLNEGHTVEVQMRIRGREKAHKDWSEQKLKEFLGLITFEFKVLSSPKFGGRGMMMQIGKK